MSTQLRLVETPGTPPSRAKVTPKRGRATASRSAPGRARVRWDGDWRLSASRRRIGLEGVAAAREALARAHRPPDPRSAEQLSEAS